MTKSQSSGKSTMTSAAASRIQSAAARSGGGQVSAKSFAARAQSAAAKPSGQKPGGSGKA